MFSQKYYRKVNHDAKNLLSWPLEEYTENPGKLLQPH